MSKRDELRNKKQKSKVSNDVPANTELTPEQKEAEAELEKKKGARANVRATVQNSKGVKQKKEHFKWAKMWIAFLVSMTMKDRGKIPDNIGDRILITNNLYITKLYMTTIVHIHELGNNSVITLIGCINQALRDRGNKAILDVTLKNTNYDYDPKDDGLQSRIRIWERDASNPYSSRKLKDVATRCLYTVHLAKSGARLKHSRIYFSIRAKDIQTLNNAEKIVYDCLAQMGSTYLPAYGNIKTNLEYISLMGFRTMDLKGIIPVMTCNEVIADMLPNCGSYNDKEGYYLGQNILNGSPYYLDVSKITVARNMYVVAPSGVGKTVLAINMAQSAYENNSACCFMDIKGNEYTSFIKATEGYIVSLRPTSTEYINSWVMHKDETDQEHAEAYFKSRIQFSKQQIIILSGITDREKLMEFEELLDEFHDSLYVSLGAIPTNMNSWSVTEQLNPYEIWNHLSQFLTPVKIAQYNINKSTIGTLRMYMSVNGSKSYVFKREFEYSKILASRTLSFDFGILGDQTVSDIDTDLFRLKFLYMSKLNGDFVTRQYAEGRRTFKVLEESQVVSKDIMQMYVQEYTLRRSQKQDTLLLGNSVQALYDNDIAKPLIENTRGLFIGELSKDARKTVLEQFGYQHLDFLARIPGSSIKYKNCFFFINNMQDKELYPIIKVVMDPEVIIPGKHNYKVLTPVKETSSMGGNVAVNQ